MVEFGWVLDNLLVWNLSFFNVSLVNWSLVWDLGFLVVRMFYGRVLVVFLRLLRLMFFVFNCFLFVGNFLFKKVCFIWIIIRRFFWYDRFIGILVVVWSVIILKIIMSWVLFFWLWWLLVMVYIFNICGFFCGDGYWVWLMWKLFFILCFVIWVILVNFWLFGLVIVYLVWDEFFLVRVGSWICGVFFYFFWGGWGVVVVVMER